MGSSTMKQEQAPPQPRHHSETSPFVYTSNGSLAFSTGGGDTDDDAHGTKEHEEAERRTLAKLESKALKYWRIVVYVSVILVTCLVSYGIYVLTYNSQKDDFQISYKAYAGIVRESFFDSIERKFAAISSFSTTITSFAAYTGATFPNVTIPDYEMRGVHNRIDADSVNLYWLPLVTDETRAGWEAYGIEHHTWINQAYVSETKWKAHQDRQFGLGAFEQQDEDQPIDDDAEFQGEEEQGKGRHRLQNQQQQNGEVATNPQEQQPGQEPLEDGYNPIIFLGGNNQDPAPPGTGPYLPLWQVTPVVPITQFLNYNMLDYSSTQDALNAALDSKEIVMSPASDLTDPKDKAGNAQVIYNLFLNNGQYRHNVDSYQGDPSSNVIVPVFDSFTANRTLGGVLQASIYWRLVFTEILPETANGIICVVSNSFDQSFTYRLDGPVATYLGPGDLHDPKFDNLLVFEDLTKHLESRAGPENTAFDTVPLNAEFCQYTLSVYPSQDTEDQFINNDPLYITLIGVGIFMFTSFVFILYDLLVARRQRIVMQKAVQSAAIVNTLYPKQIQERLFKKRTLARKDTWRVAPNTEQHLEDVSGNIPIADYYEATTILFADIKGFTKWSSSREPVDVFFLLETLYQAFDKIAVRRKVFKVETIGDCYVAVTGLPDPQPDHAVIMVKFARDCYAILNKLLSQLANKLGEETRTLNFRVGLHSGPITGGVLRGQKSRFQLFGDTINTASRMESNGVPGRIHISQQTADELEANGHKRWVTPRPDKIVAKGKGELQTYFVSIQREAMSMASGLSAGTDEVDQVARTYEEMQNNLRKSLAAHHERQSMVQNHSARQQAAIAAYNARRQQEELRQSVAGHNNSTQQEEHYDDLDRKVTKALVKYRSGEFFQDENELDEFLDEFDDLVSV